jgi:hypothetical protein
MTQVKKERIAKGLCVECGNVQPRPQKRTCFSCAETQKVYQRVWREKRMAQGFSSDKPCRAKRKSIRHCIICNRELPVTRNKYTCVVCSQKTYENHKNKTILYRKAGLCFYCGKPALNNRTKCKHHFDRDRQYRDKQNKREEYGSCVQCGHIKPQDIPVHGKRCAICWIKNKCMVMFRTKDHWTYLLQKLIQQDFRCPYT